MAAAALAAGMACGTAWGWAGMQHFQITREAGRRVPEEMAGWESWAKTMAFPSVCPDLWKGADYDEGPRHYFEADRLRGLRATEVDADWDEASGKQFRFSREDIGDGPWQICELLGMMSDAMRTNDWEWAARCGATLAHYAEDLHMPLHCIRNFNGQETNQRGAHTRIESGAIKTFFDAGMFKGEGKGEVLEDPFHAVMGWVEASTARGPRWLRWELEATAAAEGDTESEEYYEEVWGRVREEAVARMDAAATDVASLWATAWANAGKPAIPRAPREISQRSVWSGVGIDGEEQVAKRAGRNRKYDYLIWGFLGGVFFWTLVTAVARALKNERAVRGRRE